MDIEFAPLHGRWASNIGEPSATNSEHRIMNSGWHFEVKLENSLGITASAGENARKAEAYNTSKYRKELRNMSTFDYTRRDFLKAMGLGAASFALPGCASTEKLSSVKRAKGRPNIILIMADDMGFSDLSCYGSEIHTPNLMRLASQGLRFTQFYNAARCCPTRASLLTGLYPHQAGVGGMTNGKGDINPPGPYQGYLNDECVTIAEVLKKNGTSVKADRTGQWTGVLTGTTG
jgi:hypothetical protein